MIVTQISGKTSDVVWSRDVGTQEEGRKVAEENRDEDAEMATMDPFKALSDE